ncbi:hypothetical protein [Nocardia cerradoensis]|uniref:hypothetical protein n=1 Tax=Nocardia cerradoensis TaxID=85688 RepID=UPI0005856EAE|nr:hypothetical protein [Nocardia cerradoensis]NKY45441.1 hypothetical protein [Nocardia cerradoensis]
MNVAFGVQCARGAAAAIALAGAIAAAAPAGAAGSLAHEAVEPVAAQCLWADTAHPRGDIVTAGGWSYSCGTDAAGMARWTRGAAAGPSTVPDPGAATAPAGHFSAGARQPGTEYTDYCVGDQLIEGRDNVFEVAAAGDGLLFWRPVAAADSWTFDPGTHRAPPSARGSSLCRDSQLL